MWYNSKQKSNVRSIFAQGGTMALKKKQHAVCEIRYHIVLVTKYRRPVIKGEIADHLKAECCRLIENFDGEVIEIETDMDHVHILAAFGPEYSIRTVMNSLKGVTARIIRRDHWEEVSKQLWGDSFWSDSYYVGTCGGVTVETIRKYVENQGRPKRKHVRRKK